MSAVDLDSSSNECTEFGEGNERVLEEENEVLKSDLNQKEQVNSRTNSTDADNSKLEKDNDPEDCSTSNEKKTDVESGSNDNLEIKEKEISSDHTEITKDKPDVENGSNNDDLTTKEENEKGKKDSDVEDEHESTDSDIIRKRRKPTRKSTEEQNSPKLSDGITDEEDEENPKKKTKKRKRIRESNDSDSDNSMKDENDKKNSIKRKNIRKVIKTSDLVADTRKATEEEQERRRRIEERQRLYNQIYEQPENIEQKELILDFDSETKEKLLEIDPGLLKHLKPHQVNGIKFMWDACFETLKDVKNKPGSGCILAHCMGLGKTLQIIALTHALLINSEKTGIKKVLIITPLSTLTNWAKEYKQWVNFCKEKDIEVYDMSKWREKQTRVFKITEWSDEGGVCIIGYDLFRILTSIKPRGVKKKHAESLKQSLLDPGPDLVVCDEGHLLKNEKTSISKAVNKIRTKRRIVLTGTPLQNNLKEYYCMIQFVKPNLLGTYKEYLNRFVNPITNGQYTDSTEHDIKLMKHRSHVLHKLLQGCVQRQDYSVLAPYLPPKYEYTVFLNLSNVQKKLYEYYMTTQRHVILNERFTGKGAMLFQDLQNLRRIWTHPYTLRLNSDIMYKKRLERYHSESEGSLADFIASDGSTTSSTSSDSDDESIIKDKEVVKSRRATRQNPGIEETIEENSPDDWWTSECEEKDLYDINHSPKLIILMEILECCEKIGDKLLLFSQSLQSLDAIEHFLSLIDKRSKNEEINGDVGNFTGCWKVGQDYFRLDGSSTVEQREIMCRIFNDVNNLRARLFLISTKAGSLGINLVAANRVIIFDVSWNPSHDTQSIFRVYRFGQIKPCYIYRLVALGTMEQKIYERQVAKQAIAKRVIDEQQINRHYNQNDLNELYKYELEITNPRPIPILPKDRLFADLLAAQQQFIYKYHEHDSLLENAENENLSEEERKAAWAEYEAEKQRPAQQYIAYNRPIYGNPNGPATSNKLFGFRNDVLLRLLNIKIRQMFPGIGDHDVSRLIPNYVTQFVVQMNSGNLTMYRELVELHTALTTPESCYIPQMMPNMNFPPMQNVNYMTPQSNQVMNKSQVDSSEVYEID